MTILAPAEPAGFLLLHLCLGYRACGVPAGLSLWTHPPTHTSSASPAGPAHRARPSCMPLDAQSGASPHSKLIISTVRSPPSTNLPQGAPQPGPAPPGPELSSFRRRFLSFLPGGPQPCGAGPSTVALASPPSTAAQESHVLVPFRLRGAQASAPSS